MLELSGRKGRIQVKFGMSSTNPAKEPYIPLAERINQDVLHDNFVPKYSGLASAKPKLVIVLGAW